MFQNKIMIPRRQCNNVISGRRDVRKSSRKNGRSDDRVILGHLDKSHITVHTYPEYHPETSIATFR